MLLGSAGLPLRPDLVEEMLLVLAGRFTFCVVLSLLLDLVLVLGLLAVGLEVVPLLAVGLLAVGLLAVTLLVVLLESAAWLTWLRALRRGDLVVEDWDVADRERVTRPLETGTTENITY